MTINAKKSKDYKELRTIPLDNLYPGQVFKNFPEYCKLQNIPILEGNSKKSYLKDLARYVDFSIDKQKIIINSIYEFPKMKPAKKGSLWADSVGLCILHGLSKTIPLDDNSVHQVFIEKYKLTILTGLCNESFYNNIPPDEAMSSLQEGFYSDSFDKFRLVRRDVLKRLKARHAVRYRDGFRYTIAEDKKSKVVVASIDDEAIIGDCYAQVLKDMGYDTEQVVRYVGAAKSYYSTVNSLLAEKGFYNVKKGIVFGFTKQIHSMIEYISKSIDIMELKQQANDNMQGYLGTKALPRSKNVFNGLFGKVAIPLKEARAKYIEDYEGLIAQFIADSFEDREEDIYAWVDSLITVEKYVMGDLDE